MDLFGAATHPLTALERVSVGSVGGVLVNVTGTLVVFDHGGTLVVVVHSTSQQPGMKEEFDVSPVPPALDAESNDSNANCVNKLCGQRSPVSGPTNAQLPGDQASL